VGVRERITQQAGSARATRALLSPPGSQKKQRTYLLVAVVVVEEEKKTPKSDAIFVVVEIFEKRVCGVFELRMQRNGEKNAIRKALGKTRLWIFIICFSTFFGGTRPLTWTKKWGPLRCF
jgi:hypothetical protein